MNRLLRSLVLLLFCIIIFNGAIPAEYISNGPNAIEGYQSLNYGNLCMKCRWFCADSVICPVAGVYTCDSAGDDRIEISGIFFQEFDYELENDFHLLSPMHDINNFSIHGECASFRVKHNDSYNNPPSEGYPKLILKYPDGSTQTSTMEKSVKKDDDDLYVLDLHLDKGSYEYKYVTTSVYYVKGLDEIGGDWHVTTRPYNFVRKNPHPTVEVLPDNTYFSWDISSDEHNDALSYELYVGLDSSKDKLQKIADGPAINALSFTVPKLEHKRQYNWYMKVKNKYGASLETEMFSFFTGGLVGKFYNAPNPFNPAIGIQTDFVFPMYYDGTAKIIIYSEYGDKVWESEEPFFAGNNTQVIKYDGKDNSGKILYNGTYLAILTKKYSDKTEKEKCRILIIK